MVLFALFDIRATLTSVAYLFSTGSFSCGIFAWFCCTIKDEAILSVFMRYIVCLQIEYLSCLFLTLITFYPVGLSKGVYFCMEQKCILIYRTVHRL